MPMLVLARGRGAALGVLDEYVVAFDVKESVLVVAIRVTRELETICAPRPNLLCRRGCSSDTPSSANGQGHVNGSK